MDLAFDITTPAFSLANARACAVASKLAYTDVPSVLNADTNTQVWIQDCGNAVVIAFRGTQEPADFVTDAKAWREALKGCSIHVGFNRAEMSVDDEIHAYLHNVPAKPVFLAGHSLGGGLAMVCAYRWSCVRNPLAGVYTFGQPRVGNATFADFYNDHEGSNTFRFVNKEDVVPRLPGVAIGYRHAGQEVFLPCKGGYVLNPSL
ncbi:MAG: putative lipase, partial [Pedosphaera sp.]|nr:putative lipase [Pedosphaera sp.]